MWGTDEGTHCIVVSLVKWHRAAEKKKEQKEQKDKC